MCFTNACEVRPLVIDIDRLMNTVIDADDIDDNINYSNNNNGDDKLRITLK